MTNLTRRALMFDHPPTVLDHAVMGAILEKTTHLSDERLTELARAMPEPPLARLPRPATLPRLRDQMAKVALRPGSGWVGWAPGDENTEEDKQSARWINRGIAAADLYWINEPMMDVATAAAAAFTEDDMRDHVTLWPYGCGLMYLSRPIRVTTHDRMTGLDRARILVWGRSRDAGFTVAGFGYAGEMAEVMSHLATFRQRYIGFGAGVDTARRFYATQLLEMCGTSFPMLGAAEARPDEPIDPDEIGANGVLFVLAAWALMNQPGLASRAIAERDPKVARQYRRERRDHPDVTIVDLRRLRHPADPDDVPEMSRTYTHRWVVDGHWRNQPYGPGRVSRRKIWIAPYVKGPDGGELIHTEKVHVWRR